MGRMDGDPSDPDPFQPSSLVYWVQRDLGKMDSHPIYPWVRWIPLHFTLLWIHLTQGDPSHPGVKCRGIRLTQVSVSDLYTGLWFDFAFYVCLHMVRTYFRFVLSNCSHFGAINAQQNYEPNDSIHSC